MSRIWYDNEIFADNTCLNPNDKFSKVLPSLNKHNEPDFSNYLPQQTVCIDKSMVPYFGRHVCNQLMKIRPVIFGYKLRFAATPLVSDIQFYPCKGQDDFFNPQLGGSVVDKLMESLPKHAGPNYDIITDNFFKRLQLLPSLRVKVIFAIGRVWLNRVENARKARKGISRCWNRWWYQD